MDPAHDKTTVGDALARWAARPGLRDTRLTAYDTVAKNLGKLGGIPLVALTRSACDAWITQLTTGRPWKGGTAVTEDTARQWALVVSAALTMAAEDGLIVRNPMRVPRAKTTRAVSRAAIPTTEDVRALIDQLEAGGAECVDRGRRQVQKPRPVIADMVRVAVGSGMRVSELCGLLVGDVDFLRRVIRVERQAAATGGGLVALKTRASRREVPVADDLIEVLDRLCAGRGPEDRVFVQPGGKALSHSMAGEAAEVTARHLGMPFTFHSFRHFYESLLIAAGVPVTGVQAALGHESASMTLDVYSHLWHGAEDVTRRAIAGAVSGAGSVRDSGAWGCPYVFVKGQTVYPPTSFGGSALPTAGHG